MAVLSGLRVIELAESVAGEYCGKLLSDFGAELIKIERPSTGSPTRSLAPILEGKDGQRESGLFAFLNTNKQSITLDLDTAEGLKQARALIGSAAAVIDDHLDRWLESHGFDRAGFLTTFPQTVFCSVTPFGLGAPSDFASATSLSAMHASGWGYHLAPLDGPPRPPLKGPGRFLADFDGGLDAAIGLMAALVGRERTGLGEWLDTSCQAALVGRADHIVGRLLGGGLEPSPSREVYARREPTGAYRCADGDIHLYITPVHWDSIQELLGNPEWAKTFPPGWLFDTTAELVTEFRERFSAWIADKARDKLCEDAQQLDIPIVAANGPKDLANSAQLKVRGFFQELEHPVLGPASYPTVAYKLSATPARLITPAPSLGQHNGLPEQATNAPPLGHLQATEAKGPLAGIRILALTKVWAGPFAVKLLAFLGAEVIKVESTKTLDSMRTFLSDDIDRVPIFQSLSPQMKSVAIDMKSQAGMRHLHSLIGLSDVVIDNLRPGAMARMGLDYEGLRAIREDIVAVSLKMNGGEGPLAHQTGYAPSFAALSGMNGLLGYEGETPLGMHQFYGDTTAGAAIALGTLAALMHRQRSGEGQFVDVSAVEAISSAIGDSLLAYSLTGETPRNDGNRNPDMAPHGTFPCQNGEWIAIAVDSEPGWKALCHTLSVTELANDLRFASHAARQENLAALDAELARLTSSRRAAALAAQLRQAGVAAVHSLSSLDLIADEQLWQREAFTTVETSWGESRPIVGAPWRFARTGLTIEQGAPDLGEHNAYAYCELLGLSEAELQTLVDEGVAV
ncbi:MAG: CoA transferase [Novosphingobium sp.]|nr:CoA transferase [Novosphingobium sp.]